MKKNERWIAKNFGDLVDLYGGRYVAVANRQVVAVGVKAEAVERQARTAPGGGTATVLRVPDARSIGREFDSLRLFRFS